MTHFLILRKEKPADAKK